MTIIKIRLFLMKKTKSNLMRNNRDPNNCQRSMTIIKNKITLKKSLNLMISY